MTGLQMAREMREQPSVLAALSSRRSEIAERVRAVRPDAELSKVTPTI